MCGIGYLVHLHSWPDHLPLLQGILGKKELSFSAKTNSTRHCLGIATETPRGYYSKPVPSELLVISSLVQSCSSKPSRRSLSRCWQALDQDPVAITLCYSSSPR